MKSDEDIYKQFAETMAKAVDIEIAKTQLGDLLKGYVDNKVKEKRIETAIEYIENLKMNAPDEKAFDIIIEILEGEE